MKKIIEKLKKVDKGTIIRTVTLILALANQTVAIFGASTFASAGWYQVLSVVVTIATALFTAWKNNDWTHFAQLGTGVLHALKDGKITEEEVNELLNKGE
jgi:SPP1 family holin